MPSLLLVKRKLEDIASYQADWPSGCRQPQTTTGLPMYQPYQKFLNYISCSTRFYCSVFIFCGQDSKCNLCGGPINSILLPCQDSEEVKNKTKGWPTEMRMSVALLASASLEDFSQFEGQMNLLDQLQIGETHHHVTGSPGPGQAPACGVGPELPWRSSGE